jgi:hypothetical protein
VIIESGEYNIEAYMEATLLKGNMFWKPYRVGRGKQRDYREIFTGVIKGAGSCLMDVPTAGPSINLTANLLPILRPQGGPTGSKLSGADP